MLGMSGKMFGGVGHNTDNTQHRQHTPQTSQEQTAPVVHGFNRSIWFHQHMIHEAIPIHPNEVIARQIAGH
jgi:hypothetical protein